MTIVNKGKPKKAYFPHREEEGQTKERRCLGPCGEMFLSYSRGHRICNDCAGKINYNKANYGRMAFETPVKIPAEH